MYNHRDTPYMLQALAEARQDPRKFKVGAVIVTQKNEVISAHGGEDPAGKGHAEYNALTKCPQDVDLIRATIYTTLEPCNEHARAAPCRPCAEEIITRGVGRVVVGLVDTDRRVSRRGIEKLRSANIQVDLCRDETILNQIKEIMAPFLEEQRPHFHANFPFPLVDTFVGRVTDREFLSSWVSRLGDFGRIPVLVLYGIGGTGKSSLAWLWSNRDVTKTDLPHLPDPPGVAERCVVPKGVSVGLRVLWFTFYKNEGGEPFSAFLESAMEYLSGGDHTAAQYRRGDGTTDYDRLATSLLALISEKRCLVIWDGAERLLYEYFDPDAILGDAPQTVPERVHGIGRRFFDRRVARFARAFTNQPVSKLLLLSRIPCDDLNELPAEQREITGLDPDDAVEFLRSRGVQGSVSSMRSAAGQYAYHPLSLSNLAAAIIDDYASSGEIADAPVFDPGAPLDAWRRHVLEHAFQKRSEQLRHILTELSAVSGMIDKPVIRYLLSDSGAPNAPDIERSLGELVRHGLLRRDEEGNFDLHPLVRGYAYERAHNKQSLHQRLAVYHKRSLGCSTLPPHAEVERDWLTAATAFFYHTCRSGKYQEAMDFLRAGDKEGARNLNNILWYELGQCSEYIRLLKELFPNGTDKEPEVDLGSRLILVNDLALAYLMIGELQRAERLFDNGISIARRLTKQLRHLPGALPALYRGWAQCLEGRGHARIELGQLKQAFVDLNTSVDAYLKSDERQLQQHPLKLMLRLLSLAGKDNAFMKLCGTLQREVPEDPDGSTLMCKHLLSQSDLQGAATALETSEGIIQKLPKGEHQARQQLELGCLKGELALSRGNLLAATSSFETALADARRQGTYGLELRATLGMAGVRLLEALGSAGNKQRDIVRDAKELASQAARNAERSGYVLLHADAHNLMAKIELARHDLESANRHAAQAKKLASCGSKRRTNESFYYARAYREALRHLGAS